MTQDYNAKLAQDTAVIRDKVRRGMLPLVARNPALDKITREYAEAQAEFYEARRAEFVAVGKSPDLVPIAYRNSDALDRCADLVLHEELTWSHPDKMSIVEYPVMSETQAEEREDRDLLIAEVEYDHRRRIGYRKTAYEDANGVPRSGRSRIAETDDVAVTNVSRFERLHHALKHANLTDRQRQAIDLVYFDDMTQEDAAKVMGVRRQVAMRHLDAGLTKLREFMT